MNTKFSIVTLISMMLFSVSAIAADSVVVIPLGGKKSAGDAVAADVLEGKTFSNKDAVDIPGAMVNNGTVSIIPGITSQTIPAGYHNGSGTVSGDAGLISANIKQGIKIFNVSGANNVVDTTSATAGAADILDGKIAYANGQAVTGTAGLFWGCVRGSTNWSMSLCQSSCLERYPSDEACLDICTSIKSSAWWSAVDGIICGGPVQ